LEKRLTLKTKSNCHHRVGKFLDALVLGNFHRLPTLLQRIKKRSLALGAIALLNYSRFHTDDEDISVLDLPVKHPHHFTLII